MDKKLYNQFDEKIEQIMDKNLCWVVDVFPNAIVEWSRYKWIESYLLRRKQKNIYVDKIVNVIFKLAMYSDFVVYIGDVHRIALKRYEGYHSIKDIPALKLYKMCRKMILCDENIILLSTTCGSVVSIQLFNTSVYFTDDRNGIIFKEIIEKEGLFFRKAYD